MASLWVAVGASAQAVIVDGAATARSVTIEVRCHRGWNHVECRAHQRFELEAGANGARVSARPEPGRLDAYELEMRDLEDPVTLTAGERRTFDVRYQVFEASVGIDLFYPVPGLELRHPVFGEAERYRRATHTLEVPLLGGGQLRIEGNVQVDADFPPGLLGHVGPERPMPRVSARFTREAESIANGGPAVHIAGRIDLDANGVRPFFAVGYEVGFVEHLIASLWFETDGKSISEALLIEAASPGLFLLPSVAAGVGVVATQLGPRGADAALRIRLTAAWAAIGFFTDFDLFPSDGRWSANIGARLGL